MLSKKSLRTHIKEFLRKEKIIPERWDKPINIKEHGKKNNVPKDIRSQVRKQELEIPGLYVYKRNGTFLYIGKAKKIYSRLLAHNKEARETEYYEGWKKPIKNKKNLMVYWKKEEDEDMRTIIEEMLIFAHNPEIQQEKRKKKFLK